MLANFVDKTNFRLLSVKILIFSSDLQNNDIEKDMEEESGSNYGGVNEGQQDSAEEVNNIQG